MLYCGIHEVEPGMVVAASVFHPRRANIELLAPGVTLDSSLLSRLHQLGVHSLWVEHDLTLDLDARINTGRSPALHTAFCQLRHDFRNVSRKTVSAGQVQAYRQVVMQLTCELIANRNLSGLTERLLGEGGSAGDAALFTHCANVTYLALSVGLELETYIVRERRAMRLEHARDLTALGIGAMLHDVGKCALPDELRTLHEIDLAAPPGEALDDEYRRHARLGYQMLGSTRAPATARQVVLSHHQRWDGTGFPRLACETRERKRGPLQGPAIHIFCRIVAAANTLDNLLRGHPAWVGGGAGRDDEAHDTPLCAALHAFAGDRFEGWFDPVVRDMVLRRVPPFPVGSRVVLSDSRAAVVIAPSLEQPCRPAVRLLEDDAGTLDLQLHPGLHIARHAGQDVTKHLYHLPERSALAAVLTGRLAG